MIAPKELLRPLVRRAGDAFLFGHDRTEALRLARRLQDQGTAVTIAYWDGVEDTPGSIERELHTCLEELGAVSSGARLSVKVPPLHFDPGTLCRLARTAQATGVGMTLDAHAPDQADATLRLAREALAEGADTGVAVPARWARSHGDARAALDDGLRVRVVKGQWRDTEDTRPVTEGRLRSDFVELVRSLEPTDDRVSVATHDAALVRRLAQVLSPRQGPIPLELLVGLPAAGVLRTARATGAPLRCYIPYGHPSIGFDLHELARRPRLGTVLARSIVRGRSNRGVRERELLP